MVLDHISLGIVCASAGPRLLIYGLLLKYLPAPQGMESDWAFFRSLSPNPSNYYCMSMRLRALWLTVLLFT